MSLKTLLPAPSLPVENRQKPTRNAVTTIAAAGPPPYGARQGWAPRVPSDFGDGGAFPEIHFAQYPLNMGLEDREKNTKVVAMQVGSSRSFVVAFYFKNYVFHQHFTSKQILYFGPTQVDAQGKIKYDALVRQGHGKDRIVYRYVQCSTSHADVLAVNTEIPCHYFDCHSYFIEHVT